MMCKFFIDPRSDVLNNAYAIDPITDDLPDLFFPKIPVIPSSLSKFIELKDLENIVHPLVRSKTNQIIDQHTSETIIVNEIPLLLEKKMESLFDFLVIVISSEKNRLERLAQRGLTTEQATARMSKQVSDDERKAAADFLIVNDGNLDQLEADVEKIWQTLQERSFKS